MEHIRKRRMMRELPVAVVALALAATYAIAAKATTVYDTTLASPSPNLSDSGVYYGSGNPNGNFAVTTGPGAELGLRAHERFGSNYVPVGDTYSVPTGTGSGGRAIWNMDFSVDLRPFGVGSHYLSDINTTLTLVDVGLGTTHSFDPLASIADNAGWGPSGKNTAAVNLAIDWAFQNSENLTFSDIMAFLDPGFDPNANDTYRFTLAANLNSCPGGVGGDLSAPCDTSLGQVSATVVAGTGASTPVPEPSSGLPLMLGLGTIGLVGWRRRRHMLPTA